MTHVVHRRAENTQETFWKTLLTFNVTRILIAIVLFIYLVFSLNRDGSTASDVAYWQICLVYLVLAVGFVIPVLYYRRHFLFQLWLQLVIDLLVISGLYVIAGGIKSGLAILYLFPLAGSAILVPRVAALFMVSMTALFLLIESMVRTLTLTLAVEQTFPQAGLYGAAFFIVVFAINRLAAKLINQEALATQRGINLQIQEAINRLVIADMDDGILVVGRAGQLLTANPAAQRMLGLSVSCDTTQHQLAQLPSLAPIAQAFFAWTHRLAGDTPDQADMPMFVVIKPGNDAAALGASKVLGADRELAVHLKLRFAGVATEGLAEDRTIIFLQDVIKIENQAQQLKLASMGRLTASIAHEVRNPLAAISYASALLKEATSLPEQTRLLQIVSDNVARLDRMIEDILKLSRKAQSYGEPIALAPFFTKVLEEFKQTHPLPVDDMIELGEMQRYRVWFDPLHLREVIVNLLTNALRYASGRRASIRIYALSEANRVELHVQDDGPPITPNVRAHLFEPFYTTSSKGTGLGLYLARELCLNNDAMIDYEYRLDRAGQGEPTGRFVITLAMAPQ